MRRRALLMGGGSSKPFISVWKTDNTDANSTANNQVRLPLLIGSTLSNAVKVDWGDGSETNIPVGTLPSSPLLTHTYPSVGVYTIKIYGLINQWQWSASHLVDNKKIIEVKQWGGFRPYDRSGLFYLCQNLNMLNVVDVLDLSNCISIQHAFFTTNALSYINHIESWDTSTITFMALAFSRAYQFNQDISVWDISNVTTMNNMFQDATGFNKDLSAWVPNLHLDVNLANFMVGKSSANYNYQYIDNWLIAMAGRSWAGRSTAKVISFGTCQRSSASNAAHAALIADGWTITLSGTVLP